MGFYHRTQDRDLLVWGDKGLMTAAFVIIDILADDMPVRYVEYFLAMDVVGICESVEDESNTVSEI